MQQRSHGATGQQRPCAIAIGKHRTTALAQPVEVTGSRDLKSLHPPRERLAVGRFDHELEPPRNHRERDDPEVGAPETALHRACDRAARTPVVQRTRTTYDPRDHVHRHA